MADEKELRIIEEIAKQSKVTQRELSRKTNLSLGAVNLIIKRLIGRGLVKTGGLNAKKIEYILTPKGFSEKAKKSYQYIQKTIDLVKLVREEIAKIIQEEYNRGQKKFVILGRDDLADIIELALKGFDYMRVEDPGKIEDRSALILIGKEKIKLDGFRSINIADKLGELYWGIGG